MTHGNEYQKKHVKCPGRFSQLREHLFDAPAELVLEDRTAVTPDDLGQLWDFIKDDVYGFDARDPYFSSKVDTVRRAPAEDALALVPLFPSTFTPSSGLYQTYALTQGVNLRISSYLEKMARQGDRFFVDVLGKEPRDIMLPNGQNLAGYNIRANVGIGTLSDGGVSGGGIRSDSPFLLEVHKRERHGEKNLAAVIGFWAQDDTMLVSQMQSCRNASLPSETPFGVACLRIAEKAANAMGFRRIQLYNARSHPLFIEHPDNWSQLSSDFVAQWDSSAKKLGYSGSRVDTNRYEKVLQF